MKLLSWADGVAVAFGIFLFLIFDLVFPTIGATNFFPLILAVMVIISAGCRWMIGKKAQK
ncbi:hypothetical protein [Burkholderia perseverans]|uniref:hypothetical protein n=1 Tax=Burkholderia perseverans TaxID=2615214 RepID=UPI001FED7681|nr:hypothetical protein [Burkholderia perseverans]